ncbi:MAG: MBL fold metallo-hydrolase [Verrucomicrobia bacterium]|jgi:7,8-dihydropterin-6-yl-methyl-4-(beta-D-ribofuranosyl)aminobenzene 5'-phosphate synthase|nr:MBL fold metallo-hydrolase [Verrucomicrobiota bacterium]
MPEEIRITLLVENTVHGMGLKAEHGLSYHIAIGTRQVLFDTGQTDVLLANARQLGLDLSQLDTIVLSHGHYDHTGGLAVTRRLAPEARIVLHASALAPKFSAKPDGSGRAIGMSPGMLDSLTAARITFCRGQPVDLGEGLFATGEIPRTTQHEDVGGRFFLDPACRQPDPLLDDQALFFESAEGTVVLLGCAHAGVINTLRHIESLSRTSRFAAVLGGMHLLNASEERMQSTLEELRQRDIGALAPLHCTGWNATMRLWQAFPQQCCEGAVGTVWRFPR